MIKKLAILICVAALISLFSLPSYALKIMPLVDASIGVGNSYFKENASGFGGNAYLDFIPVVRVNNDIDIMPHIGLSYQGNRRLFELSGGGTLFQQSIDGNASVKYIQKISENTKFKLNAGFTKEWLRETADEVWGRGLYDYNNTNFIGGEYEYGSLRAGYNYYWMRFPNYTSLASNPAANTFSLGVGTYVFYYNVNEFYVSVKDIMPDGVICRYGYTYSRLDYPEQKIINSSAQYLDAKRDDNMHNAIFSMNYLLPDIPLRQKILKHSLSLSYNLIWNQSSQNYYDVDGKYFYANFYDYLKNVFSPAYSIQILPWELDIILVYEYANQSYLNRPAQNSDGAYRADKMFLDTHSVKLYTNYPFFNYWSVFVNASYNVSMSNNTYETYYSYNYASGSYLAGVAFKY